MGFCIESLPFAMSEPMLFSNCASTSPWFVILWIFEYRFILHKSELFLSGQSFEYLFSQLYFPRTGFCFCSFDDTNYAGVLNVGCFSYEVDITPTKST